MANGSEEVSNQVIIREVKVGRFAVSNVTAIVSPAESEPLLGQNFLSKFASWSLDNERHVLILYDKIDIAPTPFSAVPGSAGYGAVAYDTATGRRGVSWNQATAQKAAETALSQCGASGCKVLMRVGPLRCGALATTADGKGWGAASRPSSDAARLAALANCGKAKLGECIVRTTDCNK